MACPTATALIVRYILDKYAGGVVARMNEEARK